MHDTDFNDSDGPDQCNRCSEVRYYPYVFNIMVSGDLICDNCMFDWYSSTENKLFMKMSDMNMDVQVKCKIIEGWINELKGRI